MKKNTSARPALDWVCRYDLMPLYGKGANFLFSIFILPVVFPNIKAVFAMPDIAADRPSIFQPQ